VVNVESRMLGLMVDSVSEVVRIPAHAVELPPPFVDGIDTAYIAGIGKFEGRLLILVDLGKVLSADDVEVNMTLRNT
jgi:purine-binding chemotaxis protein CheW